MKRANTTPLQPIYKVYEVDVLVMRLYANILTCIMFNIYKINEILNCYIMKRDFNALHNLLKSYWISIFASLQRNTKQCCDVTKFDVTHCSGH